MNGKEHSALVLLSVIELLNCSKTGNPSLKGEEIKGKSQEFAVWK